MGAAEDWARGLGLPDCIGTEFAGEHGGRVASSIVELEDWGNRSGRRDSKGFWKCIGVQTGSGAKPPPADSGGTGDLLPPSLEPTALLAWAKEHPVPAAVGAFVILKVLGIIR